ncbi:CorA family divalent cation transporter [Agromyces albus]|uniref:Magnesium and cobalt transport protein CorA n=1 Tax=Agromyces albus TaxID=205332 RepID=A0A4Q2L154_9MICO|nr:CorA family divalent cation transporter [Agromyces albus]RXZ71764.1 hypothetical protein ESP51_07680 [Agromyces albus]
MASTARPDPSGEDAAPTPRLQTFIVDGVIEPQSGVELEGVPDEVVEAQNRHGFVWLHLVEPEEQTVDDARKVLGIHPVAAADVASGRQQPKVQMFEEHLFVLLWNVLESTESDELVLGQTYLYIGDGWLLTVQRGNGGKLPDLRQLLEDGPEDLHDGAMAAAYTIMADVVDGYAKAAADVEAHLGELEEQVFSDAANTDHRRIYKVRKDMGRIDRAVSSIAAALRESTDHLEDTKLGKKLIVPYLHDLLDDAAGTASLINNQSRALDAVLSSYENNIAARQNQDMRTISAIAALLAVPTVMAGLWGMNFKDLPLVRAELGWIGVGVAIVIIDTIVFLMFKRRRWL